MASEPLPSEFMPFGHVVGRVIRAVGDTVADPDADPEAIPVTGKGLVRFTPLELTRVVAGTVPSTWVQQETIAADLDSEGFLALSGARGLLLWPGAWKVSAGSDSAFSFPAFTIKVTSAHTADAPLDLWTAALVVPSGQQPGQSPVRDGSQLAWITPTITPSVSTLTAGSNATAAMSGSWPNLTLELGIPAGQPSTYQIVGAGRPDIPASMTTAVQAQVADAAMGATFSSTDGASVGAWQWRKIRSGWIVTYGDTGWVDVTARLANGWTATSVKVKRTTTNCLLELTSPVGTAATASDLLSVSLNGFGVDCSATGYPTIGLLISNAAQTATVGLPFWSDGQITTIRISPSASVNVPSGIRLVSWASRASWPTTLAL